MVQGASTKVKIVEPHTIIFIIMNTPSLYDHFQNYFDILLANTPELLEQVYRIRYQVYCQEFHYEREEDCPGGLEQDDYDQQSQHILVRHKSTNTSAGCVRIILPPIDDPDFMLPLEQHCGHSLNHAIHHPRKVSRANLVEISRLAVHPSFRRRRDEFKSPTGATLPDDADSEHRTFPLISLVLVIGAMALTDLLQRQHWFVMMEPRLARLLRVSGFPFEQVGELMDYHGQRAAYHLTVADCLHSWNSQTLGMYHFIHEDLQKRAAEDGFVLYNPSHPVASEVRSR